MAVRVTGTHVRLFFLLALVGNVSWAENTEAQMMPEPRVKIFNNADDALKFLATSKDEFYLNAGSYHSEESSLKRQFHLSREIHYPVIVEVRGIHYRVLVGPLSSAFAVKQLKKIVFPSVGAEKNIQRDKILYGAHPTLRDSGVTLVTSGAKAIHFRTPVQGIFYVQAGVFLSEKNSHAYQRVLRNKLDYPVIVERRDKFHAVLIGPVHSAVEVRAVAAAVFSSP